VPEINPYLTQCLRCNKTIPAAELEQAELCSDCESIIDRLINVILPLRDIVSQHQYQFINGVLVDAQSANAILTVYDHLSPALQVKYLEYPVDRMAAIAWQLVS
jgi:hypothetical protein